MHTNYAIRVPRTSAAQVSARASDVEHVDRRGDAVDVAVFFEDETYFFEHAARRDVPAQRLADDAFSGEVLAREVPRCDRSLGCETLSPVVLEEAVPEIVLVILGDVFDAA